MTLQVKHLGLRILVHVSWLTCFGSCILIHVFMFMHLGLRVLVHAPWFACFGSRILIYVSGRGI